MALLALAVHFDKTSAAAADVEAIDQTGSGKIAESLCPKSIPFGFDITHLSSQIVDFDISIDAKGGRE